MRAFKRIISMSVVGSATIFRAISSTRAVAASASSSVPEP
jgi:hypothetical protein